MPWRYQPVYLDEDGDRSYYLCEVYFDAANNFERWGEIGASAGGEDIPELTDNLTQMIVDSYAWKPVRFSDLRPGMRFEPRINMKDREDLADYIGELKDAVGRAPGPKTN